VEERDQHLRPIAWQRDKNADITKVLTMDEARRIASNIAKLPTGFLLPGLAGLLF
jgi:hypothetical protein